MQQTSAEEIQSLLMMAVETSQVPMSPTRMMLTSQQGFILTGEVSGFSPSLTALTLNGLEAGYLPAYSLGRRCGPELSQMFSLTMRVSRPISQGPPFLQKVFVLLGGAWW
jgi:hypothetical protein